MRWKQSEGITCQWYDSLQLELLRSASIHPSIHSFIHSSIHSFIRYLTEIIAYAERFQDGQLLLQHDNYQALV